MSGAGTAVGVDAGGSATAAIAQSGGRGVAGPANANAGTIEAAAEAIATAAVAAANGRPIGALHAGAAGAGSAAIAQALCAALRARFPGAHVVVEDDARIALRAAIHSGDGAVIIAGTGSIAYGESGVHSARAGGLGPVLGDEGSAYSIGLAALRRLARAYDGREPLDAFARDIATAFATPDGAALIARVYGSGVVASHAQFAALAPRVLARARDGDAAAGAIVDEAARALAALGATVCATLSLAAPRVALGGGLLRGDTAFAARVQTHLAELVPRCAAFIATVPPEDAALRFAAAALNAGAHA